MHNFDELLEAVADRPTWKVAVAVAEDPSVIEAVAEARNRNIALSTLVGDERKIHQAAEAAGVSLEHLPVVHEPNPLRAVSAATALVAGGQADILMKGYIHSDDFLRGVVHKEHGLRTGSIISHVFIAEVRPWGKLVFLTDAAMNIAPDLEQKAAILLNAVYLANVFGIDEPKVAVLAAVELVNPRMPATMDAAALAQMARRGQYRPACTVDGPLAMDNAVCLAAAQHKKITSDVAGRADVLVVPNIEAGNILAKAFVYGGGHRLVGLLVGAKAPVVLTSRADSMEAKLLSIAGAVLMVNRTREFQLKVGRVHY